MCYYLLVVLEGNYQISAHRGEYAAYSSLCCPHSGLSATGRRAGCLQKKKKSHIVAKLIQMPERIEMFWVSDCTCVSIALVRVDGQVGQVCVWVLVWRSGHY